MGHSNSNVYISEREYQESLIKKDLEFLRWQRDLMEAEREYEWDRQQNR